MLQGPCCWMSLWSGTRRGICPSPAATTITALKKLQPQSKQTIWSSCMWAVEGGGVGGGTGVGGLKGPWQRQQPPLENHFLTSVALWEENPWSAGTLLHCEVCDDTISPRPSWEAVLNQGPLTREHLNIVEPCWTPICACPP